EIMPSVLPVAQQGQIRALAVTTEKRWPQTPDPPTISETIVAGFKVSDWDGLWAPKGTPKEIIATLNAAARKALSDPKLQEALLQRGAEASPTTSEELGKFVADEMPRWQKAVEA